MRIAYLDCFAGISGDMFLGALLDAGVEPQVLHDAVAALNLGASVQIERVDRSGISATKVTVLENGKPTEQHTHDSFQHQQETAHQHHPKTQHLHKLDHPHVHEETHTHSHPHEHDHHAHGRSLSVI